MGNGSLFYFSRCEKQTVKAVSVKTSSVKVSSVKVSSVKAASVKVSTVKTSSVKAATVKVSSVNVNCQSVKCQKNGFDSLTVAHSRMRLKKQANTWFFINSHIIPVSTVKVSTTVKMGV